ncbi:regulatory protein GemA [Sphingobium aromaticiconvertens]|uniref:regulatory protein GemA n=1 Tax=Sphingobium aromaticiconvertens TaxID=365341 RepID=UPI0030164E77
MAKSLKIVAPARQVGKAEFGRRRLMIAVRAACRRQGIDDDMRKDIQTELIKKASMSDMDLGELGRLLDHLNQGWKGPMGHRAHVGKIKALWWTLYWLGGVDDPDDRAISAFVERQTGVGALNFLDHRKASSVIEALKSWATRLGVVWPAPEKTAEITAHTPDFSDQHHDRHAVLTALEQQLRAGGVLRGHYAHYLQAAMGLGMNHRGWTAQELDAAIRLLGGKARRLKAKP